MIYRDAITRPCVIPARGQLCGQCSCSPCCCPQPSGITGPTGAQGIRGVTGPTGATGTSATVNSMSASNNTGATIAVVLGGTNVPLPTHPYLDDFTVNGTSDTFTIPVTGMYLVTYGVQTTLPLPMQSRVILNGGTALTGTLYTPSVEVTGFQATTIAALTAGNTLTLQLAGFIGDAVLQNGNGANLTVIRLA